MDVHLSSKNDNHHTVYMQQQVDTYQIRKRHTGQHDIITTFFWIRLPCIM